MISDVLHKLYRIENRRIRRLICIAVTKIEKGELYSRTLRRIFSDYHKVKIGMYSHGGCFVPFQVGPYTTIGRYCSIAKSIRIINRNHPLDFMSTHALFCIAEFKICKRDLVEHIPLKIGNDVWIGHNAIVMPNVQSIGDGAVIAAGAVVNKDVPPYAVVVGNPARVVRFRFPKEIIEELEKTEWWKKTLDELKHSISQFQGSYIDHKDQNITR